MYIGLFDHPQDVTQEELERDLQQLPEWRREKALTFKFMAGRVLCSKAYLLLKEGLREYGITEDVRFEYGAHEKPSLAGHPDIHFNLSHCPNGVLCVIDNEPVGCDIERIPDTLKMDLVRYCCCEAEVAGITSSEHPETEFVRLWTMKESYLKLTGEGLRNDLKDLLTDFRRVSPVSFNTVIRSDRQFVYTVCRYSGH